MAKKKLLIVESPAKAKTINKILGSDFTVKASMGHVRDLRSKGRGKKTYGVDVENRYEPQYVVIKGREKTVEELKEAAAKADAVYLAPDPDREGEAIAWHIKEVMGLSDEQAHRVTYQAVTKKAVQEALDHPHQIDMNLVNAQQGRRILDRLVGFSLSPFLWKKVAKNLSAGRVQSVAVRMVVEREREIDAFDPQEYWKIAAQVHPRDKSQEGFEAALVEWKGEKFELGRPAASTGESAHAVAEALKASNFRIAGIHKKEGRGKPSAPFITSTLQQAASSELSFGTSRTMRVAQKLYEGIDLKDGPVGLITYMRTDSTRIDPEALQEVRDYIAREYDPEYLPEKPNIYTTGKGAQDAHEAVRPTSAERTPESVKPFLTKEQYRLYELIWRRFTASQMTPARYHTTTVQIEAAEGLLEAKGRITLFPGYTVLQPEPKKKKESQDTRYQRLPELEKDQVLDLQDLSVTQHFTKPPSRYSEASLVKALEKEGIGRPSTYAPIIKTIQDRGYVQLVKRAFHATELGMAVNDILLDNFTEVMDLNFTAGMEEQLDEVEKGKVDWVELVDSFFKPLKKKVEEAMETAPALKGRPYEGEETCPLCGSGLVIRYSKSGAFLGCSQYPECKGSLPMPGEGEADGSDGEESVPCPECGRPMVVKRSKYGKFLACTGYPECRKTLPLDKEGKLVELPDIKQDCEKCGRPMEVKSGRRGFFLACTGYPECKNTKSIDKNGKVIELPKVEGEVCEKCGSPMVVKMGRRGPFLACSGFPQCKNAKPIPKDKVPAGEDAESSGNSGGDAEEKG